MPHYPDRLRFWVEQAALTGLYEVFCGRHPALQAGLSHDRPSALGPNEVVWNLHEDFEVAPPFEG